LPANVTICAPFRDSRRTISRFITCVGALDYPPQHLRVIAVEGDSADGTPSVLEAWARRYGNLTLLTCDTGKPKYGSVVNAERFATLAQVFNTALDAVDLAWSNYVLFTPSDILFDRDVLTRLLAHDKDLIAPLFWGQDGLFHDTWGFTSQGRDFPKVTRAQAAVLFGRQPVTLDTVGGMALIRAEVLRAGCRYTAQEVDRGLCKEARAKGFDVWADPTTHIVHL
jgi:glycosyltransferase involved in cell wall biosynthesis